MIPLNSQNQYLLRGSLCQVKPLTLSQSAYNSSIALFPACAESQGQLEVRPEGLLRPSLNVHMCAYASTQEYVVLDSKVICQHLSKPYGRRIPQFLLLGFCLVYCLTQKLFTVVGSCEDKRCSYNCFPSTFLR